LNPELQTLRAVRVRAKAAGADTLAPQLEPQVPPQPGPGQALVRVRSAGVNPSDVKAQLGLMPQAVWPRTPGRDFAGTVVAGPSAWVGRDVWGSGGDIGITRDGSHAGWLLLPEAALREKPAGLDFDAAGSVGVPFVTAVEGYRRSGAPQRGQVVAGPSQPLFVRRALQRGGPGHAVLEEVVGPLGVGQQRDELLDGGLGGPLGVHVTPWSPTTGRRRPRRDPTVQCTQW